MEIQRIDKIEKCVFIFGAGASKDEGLPLQEDLLSTYFKFRLNDNLRGDLEQYFRDFFNINFNNIDNVEFPTFEEALGILELAIEKEETYGPNNPLNKLRKLRNYLVLSMGIAIENCNLNGNNSHNRLIKKLFRRGHFVQDEYGFINFNYDILLDKALIKILDKGIYVDYGINFTNEKIAKGSFEKWESPIDKKNVNYLKPHGSFNWMCCPTCNSIYITGGGDRKSGFFKTGYLHKIEHCLKEESGLYCVIEPPSYFKKYRNIYLQLIWNKAYDLLSEADKIIFIGYSFPEADIWFKYLLKRSCYRKQKNIIVINPLPENELKSKYERLLGKVTYHPITFFEFSKDHLSFL